ncbi:TPA: hypothetical protein MIQ49_09640 [Klebsiella pneumoniae]|nr:hypothetical protein AT479_04730 [Klebsiella pneumoniae]HBY1567101.1 hypothetical protein [Klebsiella pneumoniae]
MIKKMLLNRTNRIYLRKKRIIDKQIQELNKTITNRIEDLILYFNMEDIDHKKLKDDITLLINIKRDFDKLIAE